MSATQKRDRIAGAPESAIERDLKAAMRRFRDREAQFEEATVQRDRLIRDAMAAGVTRPRIAEITGLSVPRLEQIRKGTR